MTKTQIISELKSDADFYGFHLPKDLDKKKKAELEVLYEECRQSVDYYGIADAFEKDAEFGYNKVNDWHYLSKGEYPPSETDVLICIELLNNNKTVKIGAFQQGGGLLIEGFIVSIDAAIAWQSLPNLPTED